MIKHHTVKGKTNNILNFLNFFIWNIVFFSLIQFASTKDAPFVDEKYDPRHDLYDSILNVIFPIFFVILLNVSGKPGSIKNVALPLLDDILHNVITWVIPLIISFVYDRKMMGIMVYSTLNMCLHVICALAAILFWKRAVDFEKYKIFSTITLFLIFFSTIITPVFWIFSIYNSRNTIGIPLTIVFIILFGICLVTFILVVIISVLSHYFQKVNEKMNVDKIFFTLCIICFYVPNILQTLLILTKWPVNFYFVKACVFILLITLTRNVSYFIDKIPKDLLATSTSVTQCSIRSFTKDIHEIFKGSQISAEEMRQIQETMQSKIDEMQSKMNEMKSSMDKIKIDQLKYESV
ncbi:hypothetical protein C1646_754246 [Rhizophagus diaphanus]|nr:hypothetical protein C1646_754246 [Rhizophagus diaphanus] [Rhizophagus sp. MUCL 43196]